MALTRKFLSTLGIDADKIDEIISAHSETVNGLKEELAAARADAEKLPGVQKELEALKKSAGTEAEYKEKYEQEHAAFEKYKADTAAEKVAESKRNAFREILRDAGITAEKSVEKVLKYTALDDYKLTDNGKFEQAAVLLKAVKDEWPELITTEGKTGADTGNPPASQKGTAFKDLPLDQKMAYANEHPNDQAVREWLRT